MPRVPKAPQEQKYANWNAYVQEATDHIEPFLLPLPPTDDDPEPGQVEIPCPDGDAITSLGEAQNRGDDTAAFIALFGEELGPRLLAATGSLPFFVRAKLIGDVMKHYGMQGANLGDS